MLYLMALAVYAFSSLTGMYVAWHRLQVGWGFWAKAQKPAMRKIQQIFFRVTSIAYSDFCVWRGKPPSASVSGDVRGWNAMKKMTVLMSAAFAVTGTAGACFWIATGVVHSVVMILGVF